jgi:hypothetical protein
MKKSRAIKAATQTTENDFEMSFRWYCEELVSRGYLKSFEREPESFCVIPAQTHKREKHYKSQENILEDFNLLAALNYTYDFRLIWEEKAVYIFTEVHLKGGSFKFGKPTFVSHFIEINGVKEIVSYVDVKPPSATSAFTGKNSSYYTFPLIQKMLLEKYSIFINKTVPKNSGRHSLSTNLMAVTFTPNRYKFTDGGGQMRTIHFKRTTFESYVKRRTDIINGFLEAQKKKDLKKSQPKLGL